MNSQSAMLLAQALSQLVGSCFELNIRGADRSIGATMDHRDFSLIRSPSSVELDDLSDAVDEERNELCGPTAPSAVDSPAHVLTLGIGVRLRDIRKRLKLTLRETEERSTQLAQRWRNESYRISASWLDRVERENRGLSATKLIVLAYIYNLSAEDMLAFCPGANDASIEHLQASCPNSTLLLTRSPLDTSAKLWVPEDLVTEPPPEETMLLQTNQKLFPSHFRRGIIGRHDRTLEPMLLPGSVVLIDTRRRAIASRKEWTSEFDRPIYFLFTRDGYCCGFCELDKKGEWLSLVPHMLSPEPSDARRWKYRREIDVIGTVIAFFAKRPLHGSLL